MRKKQNYESVDSETNVQRPAAIDIRAKWGWAVRTLVQEECFLINTDVNLKPRIGDVVLARITRVGKHTRISLADRRFSRLYEGDKIVGVVGYRYATEAFHAPTAEMADLHLLTNAGLCGTVKDRHAYTRTRSYDSGLLSGGGAQTLCRWIIQHVTVRCHN